MNLDRKLTVKINGLNEPVFSSYEGMRVYCSFSCKMKVSPNYGEVILYNPDENDEGKIRANGKTVIVYSDYGNVVFSGEIIDIVPENREQSRLLHIYLSDCDGFFSSFIRYTVGAGASFGDAIRMVCGKCSSPVMVGHVDESCEKTRLPRGVSLFGKASEILETYIKSADCTGYFSGGSLFVVKPSMYDGSNAVVVDEDDILGIPSIGNGFCSLSVYPYLPVSVGSEVKVNGALYVVVNIYGDMDSLKGSFKKTFLAVRNDMILEEIH